MKIWKRFPKLAIVAVLVTFGLVGIWFGSCAGAPDPDELARLDRELERKMGFTPLHLAVMHNNKPAVQKLLRNGADVNARDIHGNTPLHHAMHYLMSLTREWRIDPINAASELDVSRWLLANWAEPMLQNGKKHTPLHLALAVVFRGRLKKWACRNCFPKWGSTGVIESFRSSGHERSGHHPT